MSAEPLDLRVDADENSCRHVAERLKKFAAGLHEHGTGLHRARTESEQVWQGQAGDAFRDRVRPAARLTDEIVDHVEKVSRALHSLADEVVTVKRRMDQADAGKSVAHFAGELF